jgi:hypothetical protein
MGTINAINSFGVEMVTLEKQRCRPLAGQSAPCAKRVGGYPRQ